MDDNPFASPPSTSTWPVVSVVFGAITLVYALAASCCAVPTLPFA